MLIYFIYNENLPFSIPPKLIYVALHVRNLLIFHVENRPYSI